MARKPQIILDFNTKFIDPEKRVWVIFPGDKYKFFDHFLTGQVVFADFPALLTAEFDVGNDDELRKWLALSEKVRSYYLSRGAQPTPPSKNPEDYKRHSWTGKRTNSKGVVRGLYHRANKGDLVLVTSRGGAWGTTHIGEFRDPPTRTVYETAGIYGRERIPARRVRWLGSIDNRHLPVDLWRQLVSPNAFSLLAKNYHDLIFERAYGNFVRTDTANSLFKIGSESFSTVPDMYLKLIANFAAEVAKSIDAGNAQQVIRRPITDWLFDIDETEFSANQRINVNSPGENILQSVKMTPILAVVFFALCQYSAPVLKAAELQFQNSATGGPLDECDIPVAAAAQTAFDLMSLDKLEKLCRAAQKARTLGKIETPVRTQLIDHGN
jgi:hypothetical protein